MQEKRTPHLIIVGAGLAGISAAIALKKQLGFREFTIYERASDVGGTWRDNTYPGCGSDVPSHWYSLSSELNPHWLSYFSTQPEIQGYWVNLYNKYGLAAHTKLNTAVTSADWDAATQRYKVVVTDMLTGTQTETEAEVMIWAIGGFMSPLYPADIPGTEDFAGVAFHSGRWRHDVNLSGKTVAVIGNGCSAAQFIPQISQDPSVEVINICRTPQWFVSRIKYVYPPWVKWVFAHVPLVMRWYRNFIMARADIGALIFRDDSVRIRAYVKKAMTAYIRRMAPKEYHKDLVPNYPPGCKRIIIDSDYLSALGRSNVDLDWRPIRGIVKEGIQVNTGEVVPLDVVIFATGYTIDTDGPNVRGTAGITTKEYFASNEGPQAYMGTMLPSFPNMFILLGPNIATGHASVVFSEEAQIQYSLQLIRHIVIGDVKSFDVQEKPTEVYNAWLHSRLSKSVWTKCASYYRQGSNDKGKIVGTFPGTVTLFWWITRKPKWKHFTIVGAESWLRKRRARRTGLSVLVTLVWTFAVTYYFHAATHSLVKGAGAVLRALKPWLGLQ